MSDLDALLAGIVADPHNALRWLVMADWLEDHGFPERAELVRVHRELLRTCTDPDAFPERAELHARMMDLMRAGVPPCLPQKTLTLPGGVELTMSFIPPGSFLMGSPKSEAGRMNDETLHLVALTQEFWLGQTPVTQAQWFAVMKTNPSQFRGGVLPVEMVNWNDAMAFCAAVTELTGVIARLPTEEEWEYAARAGTTTPFYWGEELNGVHANCDARSPYGTRVRGTYQRKTTPVGAYVTDAPHPWFLADMLGNVWEWCADWYHQDAPTAAEPPPDLLPLRVQREFRVIQGGSWDNDAVVARPANRNWWQSGGTAGNVGFRVAADVAGT